MLSTPRVMDIQPQGVHEFIEAITTTTYDLSRQQGGRLPYTVIREITENFIHAGFLECTVSILDGGNTLRFADQGPGIAKKDLVLRPGISSATQKMKDYIRGVGSGFPIVKEYLANSHGFISIEDNAKDGVVVTISIFERAHDERRETFPSEPEEDTLPPSSAATHASDIALGAREEQALLLLSQHGVLGPVDLSSMLGISAPTASRLLKKLEQQGMVESTSIKKRILSNAGLAYVQGLLAEEYKS